MTERLCQEFLVQLTAGTVCVSVCTCVCVCICVQEVSVSSYTLLVLHWRDVKKLGRAEPSLAQLKSIPMFVISM